MEQEITVFLAMASPLMRARLRATLADAPGVRLVGEAAAADATAAYLMEHHPQVLLTERALLREAPLAAPLTRRGAPRVLVATATDVALGAGPVLTDARAVPFTLTPVQLAVELRRALQPGLRPEAPALSPELRERFRVTGPLDTHGTATQTPAPVPPPEQASGRRQAPSPGTRRLLEGLESLRYQQRDATTGLAGPAALEQARALLPAAGEPAALMSLEVRDAGGSPLLSPGDALLRRMSAALRANVRREDLVCRAGPATFGVVMVGVQRDAAIAVRARVGRAVEDACGTLAAAAGGRLAIKMSIWEVGPG